MRQVAAVGCYETTVDIFWDSGRYVLQWHCDHTKDQCSRTSRHRILTQVRLEALALFATLRIEHTASGAPQSLTWRRLFAEHTTRVHPTRTLAQRRQVERYLKIWSRILPLDQPVAYLNPTVLEQYRELRRAGTPLGLPPARERTVVRELEWLSQICVHATRSPELNPLA